jgi:hypothetical protein
MKWILRIQKIICYLMPSSYNETGWEANDFRNIYITKLKTNSGEYAHFEYLNYGHGKRILLESS